MTILFDLDGTVIDSTEAILESFAVTFEKQGFEYHDDAAVRNLIGHPLSVMFERLGVEKEHVDNFVMTYKRHYRTIANQKTVLLPRAKEAIEAASSFARLGVVTTKTGKYSKDILDNLGIGCYFSTVIGFEDVENPKPHPEPIEKALQSMNATREESWMIGDTHLDILSAKAASVNHVAVSSGYESTETLEEYTKTVKKDVFEAVEFIKDNHR